MRGMSCVLAFLSVFCFSQLIAQEKKGSEDPLADWLRTLARIDQSSLSLEKAFLKLALGDVEGKLQSLEDAPTMMNLIKRTAKRLESKEKQEREKAKDFLHDVEQFGEIFYVLSAHSVSETMPILFARLAKKPLPKKLTATQEKMVKAGLKDGLDGMVREAVAAFDQEKSLLERRRHEITKKISLLDKELKKVSKKDAK